MRPKSGGARPGRVGSNDLAKRLPTWLSFFFLKKLMCIDGVHIRNDAVSVNFQTAKM